MKNQPELIATEPKQPKQPRVVHTRPALWVETLAVYHNWPPSDGTRLRRVNLHRGLNILWADSSASKDPASRLAGHGAGKTTFCRLLRYVLDEAHAGPLQFRKDFDEKFEHRTGWVLGEVWLGDERWLVGRPINLKGAYQSFARKGGSIGDEWGDSPPATGYKDYTTALDAAVFGNVALRQLSGSGRKLEWEGAFQWLSRDQEAHYGGLLEWRHKESESGSPDLQHTDKENLVRILLGLVKPAEQGLLRDFAEKSDKLTDGKRKVPNLEFSVDREKGRLEKLLGKKVPGPEDALFQFEVANIAGGLRKQADDALAGAKDEPELDRLGNAVSQAQVAWEVASLFLRDMQSNAGLESGRVEAVKEKATESENKLAIRDLIPSRGYCSQPLDKAWRERCPLADKRPDDEELDEALKGPIAEAERRARDLENEKRRIADQAKIVKDRWTLFDAATKARDAFRKTRNEAVAELTKPRDAAADLDAAYKSYKDACADLEKQNTELTNLQRDKDTIDAKLELLAADHAEIIELFGNLYSRIVQTLLGSAVTGSVKFSGKSIEPLLHYHGRRDSAALKLTKLLAFDLAALALGVCCDEAHHPRLLIHDSPREADLAIGIYRALFTVAHELEQEFGGRDAAFQYIVTTTEAPPEDLRQEPWLLDPTLDASDPKKRFLGVDLG